MPTREIEEAPPEEIIEEVPIEQMIEEPEYDTTKYSPDDIFEQTWDMYTPSTEYQKTSDAIQKDIVLGNIRGKDEEYINLCMKIYENLDRIEYYNKMKLESAKQTQLRDIMMKISAGRGREGFTAKIIRTRITEGNQRLAQEIRQKHQEKQGITGKIKGMLPRL